MKKFLLLFLALIVALSSFAFIGCSGGDDEFYDANGNLVTDKSKILQISVWNSGYGVQWVNDLANKYMQNHPGVAISIDAKSGDSGTGDFYNTIKAGASANETDLYLAYGPKYLQYVTGQNSANKLLEPLDDVLNTTVSGENLSIGEKIGDNILSALTYSGSTYCLTFDNGVRGIVYNKKLFDQYNASYGGFTVPKTTNELKKIVNKAISRTPYNGTGEKENQKAVFIHYSGYWEDAVQTWWLQYDGKENFDKYWNFGAVDIQNMSTQKSNFYQQGLKLGLQALYDMITPDGATYIGSNTKDYTELQSRFLESKGALMYACGSWLETEMLKGKGFNASIMNDFEMMRYPVLSDIAEKFSNAEHREEDDLIELIDYVDAHATGYDGKPEWASNADVDLVRFARTCTASEVASSSVLIPSYASAKNLAKDFLKFMYSDEGMLIFANAQHCVLNFKPSNENLYNSLSTSTWSAFSKSVYEISKDNAKNIVPINKNHPLYFRTDLTDLFHFKPESAFTNVSKQDRKDVDGFLTSEWQEFMNAWTQRKSSAGV